MKNNIGEKITSLRRVLGITQKELAEKIGLTASTITKYEKGTLEPNIDTLNKISEALNVSISDIIDNDKFKNVILDLNYFSKFMNSIGFNIYGRETDKTSEIWIKNSKNERIAINEDAYKNLQKEIEEFVNFKVNQLIEIEKRELGKEFYEKINNSNDTEINKFKTLSSELRKAYKIINNID